MPKKKKKKKNHTEKSEPVSSIPSWLLLTGLEAMLEGRLRDKIAAGLLQGQLRTGTVPEGPPQPW